MSGILCAHFGGSAPELVLNLSNTAYPNISSRLSAAGWDGFASVRLVVDPGALLNTLVIPNIDFPGGLYLLIGAGALVGGIGGAQGTSGDGKGGPGGAAIYTPKPISIENYGSIKGGGGGGGSGGYASVMRFGVTSAANGGYGGRGGGFLTSSGLTIGGPQGGEYGQVVTNTTPSQPGDWIAGDTGSATAYGGAGGTGGNWRSAGSAGQPGAYSGSYKSASSGPGASGGAAGLNVSGEAFVAWILRGDA